jgi:hypothetical protein
VGRETGLWELHLAARKKETNTMTYRNSQVTMGAISKDQEYLKTGTGRNDCCNYGRRGAE